MEAKTGLELTKAKYSVALANYQTVLQAIENISFTKDTLNQDYAPLKTARELLKKIEELRKQRKQPYIDAGKLEDDAAKSLSNPIQEILDRKVAEYTKLANEIKAEAEQVAKEEQRKFSIKMLMESFILLYSQKVAECTTNDQLISIEKLINLETGRKDKYHEFLDQFKVSCEPIRALLKQQKEQVKALATLDKEATIAAENDDDAKAIELLEAKDELTAQIDLNKTLIQEQAIATVGFNSNGDFQLVLPEAPKARRTSWEVELIDSAKALKEVPQLLALELNTMEAKNYFKGKRLTGEIPKTGEITLHGIRYFEKITY
jgi:hypothetical protein